MAAGPGGRALEQARVDAGRVLARGTLAELRAQTGRERLEEVFVTLVRGPAS